MSYSRWSDSKWYAFWQSSNSENLDSQTLSLWHCDEEQTPNWSYAELREVDRAWLCSRYPGASDDDIREAMGIINIFQWEVEQRDLRKRFKRLIDTVRRDPSPQNVDVMVSMFMDNSQDVPSSGELLDFLFSLPAFTWESRFLGKLESVDIEAVCKEEGHFLQLLECIDQFADKRRFLTIVRTWADELSRRLAAGQVPAPPASSREEELLLAIFGRPSSPEKLLQKMREALSKLSSDTA